MPEHHPDDREGADDVEEAVTTLVDRRVRSAASRRVDGRLGVPSAAGRAIAARTPTGARSGSAQPVATRRPSITSVMANPQADRGDLVGDPVGAGLRALGPVAAGGDPLLVAVGQVVAQRIEVGHLGDQPDAPRAWPSERCSHRGCRKNSVNIAGSSITDGANEIASGACARETIGPNSDHRG